MQDIDQKMNLITEGIYTCSGRGQELGLRLSLSLSLLDSAPEFTNPVKELKDGIDQRLKAVGRCACMYLSFIVIIDLQRFSSIARYNS